MSMTLLFPSQSLFQHDIIQAQLGVTEMHGLESSCVLPSQLGLYLLQAAAECCWAER